MSFGLSHIRRFAEARTAEERRNILAPLSAMHCNAFFLAQALEESVFWGWAPLENFEPDEEEEYIPNPWYADADNRPETVWRWAHASQPSGEFTFSPFQAPLRKWAYVIWDRRRIDDWKVMEKPWEYVDRDTCENLESARAAEKEKVYETRAYP